jgi:hypothetical protein
LRQFERAALTLKNERKRNFQFLYFM